METSRDPYPFQPFLDELSGTPSDAPADGPAPADVPASTSPPPDAVEPASAGGSSGALSTNAPNGASPSSDAACHAIILFDPRDVPFSAGHFFKWLLALVGLFAAVLGLELLASVIIVASADAIDSLAVSLGYGEGAWYGFLLSGDGSMAQSLFIQLVWLIAVVPWWLHVRRRGIGLPRRGGEAMERTASAGPVVGAGTGAGIATGIGGEARPARGVPRASMRRLLERILAIVMLGVGLQVIISIILTLVLPLFPEVHESYDSMMEDSGTTTFSLLTVLSVAVAAPVVEEITFRGIAFQFALRAVCPAWRGDLHSWEYRRFKVSGRQFWAANILQAAVFGAMHLNITQGLYAFAIGLVAGWVFWRTGELRWGMGLHAVLNFASYFVNEILDVCSLFGLISPVGEFLVPILLTYEGIRLFRQGTERSSESVQNNGPGQDAGPVADA